MAKTTFKKELLVDELDLPWEAKEKRVIDTTRWSIIYEIVFEYDGKNYMTTCSVGATEQQYEEPWEFEDDVECTEVELREVVVKKWVDVDE
jgi:hypothetical protein